MDNIEEQDCCDSFTNTEYLGLFDCQIQEQGEDFARSLFRNQQFRSNKVSWDELKRNFQSLKPTILCDPCATVPVLDSSNMFMRRSVTGISLKSMIAIECGELESEKNKIQPGVNCNEIMSDEEALRMIRARKSLMQAAGFDESERDIAWEMLITQGITLPESDYLPDGGQVYFPRDEELNISTSECFGKGQCDTFKILRQFMETLECHDGSNRVTDLLMHCETAEDFLNGDDLKDCLKSFNPQLFLNNNLISQMTNRELIRPRGVSLFYTSPEGVRFWKVNIKKKYCTEDGTEMKYDMFPKNKILALDLSGSSCSYAPIWGYTPITDLVRLTGGGSQVQTQYTSRFVKDTVTFDPAGWKQVMQSNMLPFLPYANSSAMLTLCAPANKEAFKAPVKKSDDVVTAPVKRGRPPKTEAPATETPEA